jgi:hypothetical protein
MDLDLGQIVVDLLLNTLFSLPCKGLKHNICLDQMLKLSNKYQINCFVLNSLGFTGSTRPGTWVPSESTREFRKNSTQHQPEGISNDPSGNGNSKIRIRKSPH